MLILMLTSAGSYESVVDLNSGFLHVLSEAGRQLCEIPLGNRWFMVSALTGNITGLGRLY